MSENPHRPKVTLEDLIRFKRAEKPRPEFWNHFENELRAKQLAAIVEKRVWWRTSLDLLAAWRLPIGAALVVGLVSIVAVRQMTTPPSDDRALEIATTNVQLPATDVAAPGSVAPVQDFQSAETIAASGGEQTAAAADVESSVQVAEATARAEAALPAQGGSETAVAASEPVVDYFSENSIAEEVALPNLSADLPTPDDGAVSALFVSVAGSTNVDPLSQMAMPQTAKTAIVQEVLRKGVSGEQGANLRVGYLAVSESKLRNLSTVGL